MIEAFRLGAAVGGETLWDGLDLAFGEGEVWVVTGPPSCGKTLLLTTLRGLRPPEAGDVLVGGLSLYRGKRDAAGAFRSLSGIVPECPASPGGDAPEGAGARDRGATVADLFRLSAMALGGMEAKERRQREGELLSLVGLEGRAGETAASGIRERALASLSLSERARVALAAELFRSPQYLFGDMLLANVGRDWTDTLWALFRALAREGRTIILAERTIPSQWPAAKAGGVSSAGPFLILHLGPVPATPGPSSRGEPGNGVVLRGGDGDEPGLPPGGEGEEGA